MGGGTTVLEEGMGMKGTIPSEVGQLSELRTLLFQSNKGLNGTIPHEIFGIETLDILSFYDTSLSGSLSSHVGHLSKLRCECSSMLGVSARRDVFSRSYFSSRGLV